MSNKSFFWGSLLVSIGATLFALQRNWITSDWHVLRDLWAVLLILWGISMLLNRQNYRWIVLMITGAFAGFLVASTISTNWIDECGAWNSHGNHSKEHFHDWNWSSDADDVDEAENEDSNKNDDEESYPKQNSDSTSLNKNDTTKKRSAIY